MKIGAAKSIFVEVVVAVSAVVGVLLLACVGGGARTTPAEEKGQPVPPEEIRSYLVAHVGHAGFDGRVFCAYTTIAQEQHGTLSTLYLWTVCQEYYRRDHVFMRGSGVSAPVALVVDMLKGSPSISGHRMPRDGSFYADDVRAIFPKAHWRSILPVSIQETEEYNQRARMLEDEAKNEAARTFDI